MDRRTALKTAATAASAGLMLGSAGLSRAKDGTELFYRDWGAGRPVVLVHGWGLNSEFWQYQMIHLAGRGFRCVACDRRGHGRSGDPGRGYDYDTFADDLAGLLHRADLRNVTLVGHSMGGGDVVRYLTRHGRKRVARVVLVGAALPLLLKAPDYPEGVDPSLFDGWRRMLSTDFPKWLAENETGFWMPETSAPMKEWGRSLILKCSLQAAVDSTRAMGETDFRKELRALRVPTLIVHGTQDRSIPIPFARRTAQLIPGSRLEEYAGAPHGLPITHMERFNQELLAFME